MTARRAWLVALAGGALAVGSAAQSAADQVIDAGANAQAAADALNEGCADMAKCEWEGGKQTTVWGPQRILGDVLYNCSEEEAAETAVSVSDERGESTSLSESISLEISLGFLGLEKNSAEFKVFSQQAQTFSTEVTVTNAISVSPGWKAWTSTQMASTIVNGSAYITDGIELIEVQDIELRFPGVTGSDWASKDTQVKYISHSEPMSVDDVSEYCDTVGAHITPPPPIGAAARGAQAPRARQAARRHRFKVTICRPKQKESARRRQKQSARRRHKESARRRCARRTVTGVRPPRIRKATAKLTRIGRTYAVETNRRGGIRLKQRRTITPGHYKLIIREKPTRSIVRKNGKRLHRAVHHKVTTVPVTIRWTRRKGAGPRG